MGGNLVAAALRGSWRRDPPAPTVAAAELDAIAPLLLDAGCGALAWWRVRGTAIAAAPVGERLRDAYRLHTLQAAVHEHELREVVEALETAGIDALIVKGWAAARQYAEPGLRPYGDIDICVAPPRHEEARAVIADAASTINVDMHAGLAINSGIARDIPSFEEAWSRTVRAEVDGAEIRILAPEEHLLLLCVHLLTHGAWRPLWLCDIAAALECLPDDFEWGRCLGRTRRLETWVAGTVALAERLLGARARKPPPIPLEPPRWLEPAVLKQWGSPRPEYPGDLYDLPAKAYLRPNTAMRVLRAHWVDPVMATVQSGAPLNALPRLPFRVRFVAWKATRFLRGLAGRAA